ncbi:GYF domain-containing protein [Akkermansiaceae bacterium]|nr:GYF domain-containing protein [Akkermansiaceae bacterium]MDB4525881.1 GYF domain-containing protein [Akkermansiaceae bacterium]MDB4547597.1 GYF domain-containing protein [Akkermansiaceae bacterium]
MSEWYYGQGGQQEGPFDEEAMRGRIAAGQVSADDLVWREGMAEWLPLAQVSELAAAPATAGSSPYETPATNPTGAPATTSPYASPPPTSGLAIAALVLGILAIISSCMYVGILFGIPAVICGHMAMKSFRDPQLPKGGKGMAIAGLICGYLGSLISLVIIGFVVFAINSSDGAFKEIMDEAQRQQLEQLEREAVEENAD